MQHISFIQRIGGTLSARTDREKTLFFQTVSSNQMAIVLWLEADRMKSLSISYTRVEQAKSAIIEEIKQKKSRNLFQNSSLLFDKLLFSDYIYYHPIIGEESDIRNISLKDVFNFHSTYYCPNNAVICITGNIDKQKTIYLIRKYFQSIPAGKPVPAINNSSQMLELTSKTESITNPLVSTPGFFLGYRISPPYSRDYYTMSVIEYLLLKGESSRLYQRLAKKERTAQKIEGGIRKIKNRAIFSFFVTSTNNYTRNRSKKAILSELNKLKSTVVSENELTKAKNLLKTAYIKRYSTSLGKAFFLIETFLYNKNVQTFQDELNKYLEVTSTSIIGIANRYFNEKSILVNIETK
jgi:predicted Zn-dependent peptidase